VSAEADPRDRHAHPDGDLLLGQPAPLAHLGLHRGDGRAESLLTPLRPGLTRPSYL